MKKKIDLLNNLAINSIIKNVYEKMSILISQ